MTAPRISGRKVRWRIGESLQSKSMWNHSVAHRNFPPKLFEQLRKGADDAVRRHRAVLRQPLARRVHPDPSEAKALGRVHVPFVVVADHPGVLRLLAELAEVVQVDSLLP